MGGGDGDGDGSGSDSSDSSDSETEDLGEGDVDLEEESTRKERTLKDQAKDLGIEWHDDESPRDYRSVGSEVFEGGDLEAGETLQGMYDFMDDIVETQHVPTIRDPFDMRGKFHR